MSGPASRRGFLRGLTTLPLIGGSVTLIGQPTAVADSASPKLLGCYLEWLRLERQAVADSLGLIQHYGEIPMISGCGAAQIHHRDALRAGGAISPADRAAVVLSAVGCDWTGWRWA